MRNTRFGYSSIRVAAWLCAILAVLTNCSSAPGDPQTSPVTSPPGQVTVSVEPNNATLAVGSTQQLVASIDRMPSSAVTWVTADAAVATVSASGLATGVGPGSTRVTATALADPSQWASATVTVSSGPSPSATPMSSGVPTMGLSGSAGQARMFRISVPGGAEALEVTTQGGTGDADLRVTRSPQAAPGGAGECRSVRSGTAEQCRIGSPTAGDWYVVLAPNPTYSGVTLTATVTMPATPTGRFILSPNAGGVVATPGGTAQLTLTVVREGGFAGGVELAVAGLPAGVTASFSPSVVGPAASTSVLTLNVSAAASAGTTSITISGASSGVAARTALVQLTVSPATGTGGYTLNTGQANVSVRQGTSSPSVTVMVGRSGGFTNSVGLRVEGLPAGVNAVFNTSTVGTSASTAFLTLTASATAAVGTSTVTIRGTAAGLADRTVPLQVVVERAAGPGGSLARIDLRISATSINIGDDVTVSAYGYDANGDPYAPRAWTWSVSNPAIVTPGIIETHGMPYVFGKYIGRAGGTTTITVTADGRQASITLNVINATRLSTSITGPGRFVIDPNKTGYRTDELVTIRAERASVWDYFVGWGGDCASTRKDATCRLLMDRSRFVTGSFALQSWTASWGGSGLVTRNVTGGTCTWDLIMTSGRVEQNALQGGSVVELLISINVNAQSGRRTGTATCNSINDRISTRMTATPDQFGRFVMNGQMGPLAVRVESSPKLGTWGIGSNQSGNFYGELRWTYKLPDGSSVSGNGESSWEATPVNR